MTKTREKKKISFPMIARYNYAIRYFVEQGLEQTYVMQPRMTKRTMELGAKYAPDMVCTPFKTILGSMIESLEAGADTLLMSMGYCRLGYYGELAEQILRDLGYSFGYVNFAEYTTGKNKDYLKALKKLCPDISPNKTVEGSIGGIVMAPLLVALYLFAVSRIWHYQVSYPAAVVCGIGSAFAGQLGDLSMSFVKRRCGIKDFGKLLPGHGGILDRFDSILFAAPLCELLLLLIPAIR